MAERLKQVGVNGCGRFLVTPQILENRECLSALVQAGGFPNPNGNGILDIEGDHLVCNKVKCVYHDPNKSRSGQIIKLQ